MKFCKICNNILINSTSTNELIFVCNNCGHKEKSSAKETLLYSESIITENTELKFEKFIQNAYNDPTNPYGGKCKTCGKLTKYIRIGTNMQRIDVCDHKISK
jgi:DNA-directed RNA polymerase subunit M/transcription elongation factor TFIIS